MKNKTLWKSMRAGMLSGSGDIALGSEDMRPIRAAMTGLLREIGVVVEDKP